MALCCVGLAFDKGADFAIDKAAGAPCPNLAEHLCSIHARLGDEGFRGCTRYDCQGAGQRTVALFDGISWRDRAERLHPMLDTFADLRRIHELIALLDAARRLPLPPEVEARRAAFLHTLCPAEMTRQTARNIVSGPLPAQVRAFLRTLAPFV